MDSGDENDCYVDNDDDVDYCSDDTNIETAVDDGDCNFDDSFFTEDLVNPDDHVTSHQGPDQNYTILGQAEIQQLQENVIAEVSTVLSVSRATAALLLLRYNWSVSKVHDAWFTDEDGVRKSVGLFAASNNITGGGRKRVPCGICFDVFRRHDEIVSAACGHPFCRGCWEGYITTSITDGPGCLMLRCPDPSCSAAVDQDMVNTLVLDGDQMKKYSQYLLRSYIEENKKIKWCPGPGCECAVEFVASGDGGGLDVTCRCSYSFCWNCVEEAHRPVDCQTVAKWILKQSDESENPTWLLAHTKPCPKCKRPIEKNDGCMHMTCKRPCNHQFCWICLGDWYNHGTCNKFKEGSKEAMIIQDSERQRHDAKKYIVKYNHYYERWAANHSSWQKALSDLRQVQSDKIEELTQKLGKTINEVWFIKEAWQQIVECRRVLKWTYAYGFYRPDGEKAKKRLFEYLQGQAESGLERLHGCAEKEAKQFYRSGDPSEKFNEFEVKLKCLTSVTKKYFEKLLRALENGLSEVQDFGGFFCEDCWHCDRCTYANSWSFVTCEMCHLHC